MSKFAGYSVAVATILLSGCASTIAAVKGRPIAAHPIEPYQMYTMTGERRLAFLIPRAQAGNKSATSDDADPKHQPVAWCAESLPEASQALSATSKPTVGLSKNSTVGTEDAYTTTLTQTFARTEITETLRQTQWYACQAWLQGIYTDDEYKKAVSLIVDAGLNVVRTRASQSLTPPPKPDAAGANALAGNAGAKADEAKH